MDIQDDPDTNTIKYICESLIDAEIKLNFNITLKSGYSISDKLKNCNIVGNCLEDIIFPFFKSKLPTIE